MAKQLIVTMTARAKADSRFIHLFAIRYLLGFIENKAMLYSLI